MKTDYWGSYITEAVHEDPWDEEVPCRHPKYKTESYSCGDSKTPKTCTRQVQDGYEHPYDVDYHPDKYSMGDSQNGEFSISPDEYSQLVDRFHNQPLQTFREMNRHYHSIDGDAHFTTWLNDFKTLYPITTEHSYENRIVNSKSIFRYRDLEEGEKKDLYPYPDVINNQQQSVIGYNDPDQSFEKINALYGANYQYRNFVLIWKNKPLEMAVKQESLWQGGNKNELNICIGLNKDNQVEWAYVFSWTKQEKFKADIKSEILKQKGQELNLQKLSDWIKVEVPKNWKRREFKEFIYLDVQPNPILVWAFYILLILGNTLTVYFIVHPVHDIQNIPMRSKRFR